MLGRKLRLDQISAQLANKRVLMRVDFNVPIKNNRITDLNRIQSTLESINYIRQAGAKSLTLISHLGRPDGQANLKYSLAPLIPDLSRLLKTEVQFLPNCVGPDTEQACKDPKQGSVTLLENLRFHLEEEGSVKKEDGSKVKASPDKVQAFRNSLSSLGDVFVNDAFGTAHRAHSSVVGINLPLRAAGFLMAKELTYFSQAVENPKRPLLVILGGAKIKDKIPLILNLMNLCDEMIIAGGMCFTFKKVLSGYGIGKSLFDKDSVENIPKILEAAKNKGVKVHLPVDFWCGTGIDSVATPQLAGEEGIGSDLIGLDVGPESVKSFAEVIARARTVVWNGPPGLFENKNYSKGSEGIYQAIISHPNLTSIVGGGDTAAFVQSQPHSSRISHISTGGGASLELLEGKVLPGISALSDS